jgi:N-acetylmuramoyl-L-alanine amidase
MTYQRRVADSEPRLGHDCHRAAVSRPRLGDDGAPRSGPRRGIARCFGAVALLVGCVSASPIEAPTALASSLAGTSIFLDPGHNGGYDSLITRQVPNGRGGTKPCNTTGTATNDGYAEHAFTWDVTLRIRDALNQLGAHTELSRADDNSVGPCVDQRAASANAMHPDAIVSIHADGAPSTGHGFHVNYSNPPLNAAQRDPAVQLAHVVRDSLASAGFAPSTYLGTQGLYGRADLAGLNLAEYPAVLVELGNMKNSDDAAQMQSADGRAKYAAAVTDGIVAYLSAKGPRS